MTKPVYEFSARTIRGEDASLELYRGKVLLVVNTASQCGYTPQYKGLEALHKKYEAQGFSVLGFPCNQFGGQEPGGEAEIAKFCELNFGVSFPMFAKIEVNGAGAHPLFKHLETEAPGILGSKSIKWNFTKFLVDRRGLVRKRFGPRDEPTEIAPDIEAELGK